MPEKRLIVGLGNPGRKYQYTRHNMGFLAVGHLAQKYHLRIRKSASSLGAIAEGEILGKDCCLLLPHTFMNRSGLAVEKVSRKKGITPQQSLVICDDIHLDFGQMRLRRSGSHGGHNGLDSIVTRLGTRVFPRVRIGIGQPRAKEETVDYVLGEFSLREKKQLDEIVERAVACCEVWLTETIEQAMSQFNKKEKHE